MQIRQPKQADYIDWVFPEAFVIGNGDAVVVDDEIACARGAFACGAKT